MGKKAIMEETPLECRADDHNEYDCGILRNKIFVHLSVPFLYRSPNIVRVIKSRRLRWAGHVARMEDGR